MVKMRTAKQKAALRKAQLASARKRKGKGKSKLSAKNRRRARAVGGAVAVGAMMYASYRIKGGRVGHKAKRTDHTKQSVHSGTINSPVNVLLRGHRINQTASRRLTNRQAKNLAGEFLTKQDYNRRFSLPSIRKKLNDPNYVWEL